VAETRQPNGAAHNELEMLPLDAEEAFDIQTPADYHEITPDAIEMRVPPFAGGAGLEIMPIFVLPDGSLVIGWRVETKSAWADRLQETNTGDPLPNIEGGLNSAQIIRASGAQPMPLRLLAVTRTVECNKVTKHPIVWTLCCAGDALKTPGPYRYEIAWAQQRMRPAILIPIRDDKAFAELVKGTMTQWNDAGAAAIEFSQVMRLTQSSPSR
jgi:hypothetical protein